MRANQRSEARTCRSEESESCRPFRSSRRGSNLERVARQRRAETFRSRFEQSPGEQFGAHATEKNHSVGTAEDLAVGSEHSHFFERLCSSQVESLPDPLALERFEIESALCKDELETEG